MFFSAWWAVYTSSALTGKKEKLLFLKPLGSELMTTNNALHKYLHQLNFFHMLSSYNFFIRFYVIQETVAF